MADHIDKGKIGEQLAADYVAGLGFEIIERNWRYRRSEIDIIAAFNSVLHFIEVKTRTSTTYGYPEESVSVKKIETILKGAARYCFENRDWQEVQYDVLSIVMREDEAPEYLFIQDIG